jgi:aminopeptidase N
MPKPTRPGLILSALGVAALSGCDQPSPPSTDLGVAWDLAEHRARTLSDVSYDIDLTIPESQDDGINGRTIITFDLDDPDGHPVVVDFTEPGERVRSVRLNGTEVPWEPVNDHVVVPGDELTRGSNQLELTYIAGDDALNRNEDFLYTLFVPDRAHFSLPVFDQPNVKASVRWTLRIPESWEGVANGPLDTASEAADGRVLTFTSTEPIPTYLFAFAAGRFEVEEEEVDGRRMRMYHRETDTTKVARNRDAIFELHGQALSWLEDYTGIDHPFGKFDFVLIPSFQYGGMEHPGGILYNASGLMLDETATQGQILGRASVIAHETAHMWFGNLVTMDWFDDVWMKEVFANFMAAKIVHPSFPDIDHDLRFLMAHHPSAYGVDRTPGANPIRQELDNLREAGTVYRAIIYQKAPIVMRQLEARLGEEAFRDGLRDYLAAHAYGNATWTDLIEVLDQLSPEDLRSWSRVWVEEPDRPTIRVAREGADVVLTQSDPADRRRVWPQTLHLRLGRSHGDTLVTVELGPEPARVPGVADDRLQYVLPNGSGVEYGLFLLDDASLAYLADHLPELESGLARGSAWVTLWDQVLEQRVAPEPFLDLALAALPLESDELILSRVLGYAGATFWGLLHPDAREERSDALEAVLWEEVMGDRPATARSAFFSTWRAVATTPDAVARMRRLWAGDEELPGLPLSENDQTALATGLALRGVDGWSDVLDAQDERIANPDRKARFQFVRPSLDADPEVRAAFFQSLADPANRTREPWVLAGLGNLHHPLRGDTSLSFIRPALDMIEEIQRTGDIFFPGRWLNVTLGGHGEVEAAEAVRAFLDERPDLPPRLRVKVLQSADGVWRAAAILHGWER